MDGEGTPNFSSVFKTSSLDRLTGLEKTMAPEFAKEFDFIFIWSPFDRWPFLVHRCGHEARQQVDYQAADTAQSGMFDLGNVLQL
jgi:hypothetical protein